MLIVSTDTVFIRKVEKPIGLVMANAIINTGFTDNFRLNVHDGEFLPSSNLPLTSRKVA